MGIIKHKLILTFNNEDISKLFVEVIQDSFKGGNPKFQWNDLKTGEKKEIGIKKVVVREIKHFTHVHIETKEDM